MAERLSAGKDRGVKKNAIIGQTLALPEDYRPRGAATRSAPCT